MRVVIGIITLVALISNKANAQKAKKAYYENESVQSAQTSQRALSDTLGYDFYTASTTTCYKASGSGYVFGNNLMKDSAKAIQYDVNYPVQFQSIIFKLSKKIYTSNNIASSIKLNIHLLDAKGQGLSETKDAPGTIIYSTLINIKGIDTGVFINVPITDYISTPGSFAISVSFEKLVSGDTIGLESTLNGVYLAIEHSWEKEENNFWKTTKSTWNIDAMPALFAYASDITGIRKTETDYIGLYPNPTSDFIYLNSNLLNKEVKIIDANGRELYKGLGKELIDVRDFANGIYTLSSAKGTIPFYINR